MLILLGMLIDPNRCPADKVGGKNGHGFLQVNGWFGTHFESMEIEDLFRFLDASLDGLASIVLAKPGGQIGCCRCLAEMCQGTVLEGLSRVITLDMALEGFYKKVPKYSDFLPPTCLFRNLYPYI